MGNNPTASKYASENMKRGVMEEVQAEESNQDREDKTSEGALEGQKVVDESKADTSQKERKTNTSSDLCKCSQCGKVFVNFDFLNKHELSHQQPKNKHSCSKCGEVLKTRIRLLEHEQICFAPSEETWGIKHVTDNMNNNNGDSVGSPPSKRALLEVSDKTNESKVNVEDYDDCVILYGNHKSTQINKAPETQSITLQTSANPVVKITAQLELKKKVKDIPCLNSKPEERIQKSDLSFSAGIYVRSTRKPNELMIVWCESLYDDLIEAVYFNQAHALLCIKESDLVNLTNKQNDIIGESDRFIFKVLDDNDKFTTWTVISFRGNIPVLANGKFRNFVDVEINFSNYAESHWKSIHHVMKNSEEGLFPFLSQHLVKNITVFK